MVRIGLIILALLLSAWAMYQGKVDYGIYTILVAILLQLELIADKITKWTSR